jgi:C-terminal processing protease CtpA/Prc
MFSVSFLICLAMFVSICAQEPKNEMSAAFRDETIDSIVRLLKDRYSYPEIAQKMETALREKQKSGEYDQLSDGKKFAEKLTTDLRAVFNDKHLRVSYIPEGIPVRSAAAGEPTEAEIAAARRRQTRENFGLEKVEILKGNVGYIKLNYFAPLDWSADAYPSAFGTVVNTDALIIDIRENRGSMDIDAIPYFSSFLFDRPVQVGDYYLRHTGESRQLWTYARVPGKKYVDKPVFILTGAETASGAESFVRHLKNLKRALSVGETTMGATMPGGSHRVNDHFSIWISTGRAPNAKAENENKGISPDIAVAAQDALREAHFQALNRLLENEKDDAWKEKLKQIQAEIRNK